jgi:O-antigen/teichoic acid export membrane protein
VLWAHERFDLINSVDVPCVILRSALTIVLVGSGPASLVTLAMIILAITVLRGVGQAWLAFRVDRSLRLQVRSVRLFAMAELFDVGIWCFLMSIANAISGQLGPFLIGNRFSVALVTPFSAASRLVNYVRTILTTSTGVLTPLATRWHAAEEHEKQRWLFIGGGKFSMALGLFFFGGFWFLGEPFLKLWTGSTLDFAWPMLMILMVAELLPLSQRVTFSTVMGMNRHRLWAVMSLLEVVLVLGLAAVLLGWVSYSILSVVVALAVPGALCRGLVQMVYACRLLRVPVLRYVRQAFLPPVLAAAGPTLLLGLVVAYQPANSWWTVIGFGLAYTVVFGLATVLLLTRPDHLRDLIKTLRRRAPAVVELKSAGDQPAFGEAAGTPVLR